MVEKRVRDVLIVDRFKKAEHAHIRPVFFVETRVVRRDDTSENLGTFDGEEHFRPTVTKKRIPFRIEFFARLKIERRGPIGVVFVNFSRKFDKLLTIVFVFNFDDFHCERRL